MYWYTFHKMSLEMGRIFYNPPYIWGSNSVSGVMSAYIFSISTTITIMMIVIMMMMMMMTMMTMMMVVTIIAMTSK